MNKLLRAKVNSPISGSDLIKASFIPFPAKLQASLIKHGNLYDIASKTAIGRPSEKDGKIKTLLVQCKLWRKPIPPGALRDFKAGCDEEKVEGEETTTIGENTEETTNDEVVEETTANEETEIKQSEPVIEQIDIAVVGGGVAGVYAAYKLQRRYPKKKIYVYGIAQTFEERDMVISEAKEILDVENVIASIILVEDLRIQKE